MDLTYYVRRKLLGFLNYHKKMSSLKGIIPSNIHYAKTPIDDEISRIKIQFYQDSEKFLKIKKNYPK
jgi:hypothetical protein